LFRKKVVDDERLIELTMCVEERKAAVQDLRQALKTARANNAKLETAIEEVCFFT
jgi:hypothetical protein